MQPEKRRNPLDADVPAAVLAALGSTPALTGELAPLRLAHRLVGAAERQAMAGEFAARAAGLDTPGVLGAAQEAFAAAKLTQEAPHSPAMTATCRRPMVDGNRRVRVEIIIRLGVILAILTGAAVACSPAPDNSGPPPPPATSFPSSPPATAPTLSKATIESLRDQDTVSGATTAVEGTSTGVVGSPHEIWVVVLPAGTGRFHPQTPAAVVTPDGRWRASNVHLGQPGESGLKFTIYAVVATETASAEFRRYFEGHTTDFPGLSQLPYGATPTHDITVTTR